MTTFTSISDFLEAHGYKAEGERYVKRKDSQVTMWVWPEDWAGLTVDAFIQKAREKGWVEEMQTSELTVKPGERVLDLYRMDSSIPRRDEMTLEESRECIEQPSSWQPVEVSLHAADGTKIKSRVSYDYGMVRNVVAEPALEDLKNEINSLNLELKIAYLQLANLNNLLNMIPLCPVHQVHCLHYAQEWVAKTKEQAAVPSTRDAREWLELLVEETKGNSYGKETHPIFPTSASPYSVDFQDVRQMTLSKKNKKD